MFQIFLTSICLLYSTIIFAQVPRPASPKKEKNTPSYQISGYVKEASSGETLIGATIYNLYDSISTSSNIDGYYTLNTKQDSAWLQVSYVGYKTIYQKISLEKNTRLDFSLEVAEILQGVIVENNSNRQSLKDPQMSVERITAKQAKEIVAMMGEADIIKLLQLKPGVQASIEGSSGLYVRGGRSDQNLFLLDGATLYNPSHLLGLFSTFNTDAIKNVQLYKGSFPTRFGGRLSSVLDVTMREGNKKKIKLSGGIGLIAGRLLLEGPLVKEKGSFLVAMRSSYAQPFLQAINKSNKDNPSWTPLPEYHFYDANLKSNITLSSKDKLFLSAYTGSDYFNYNLKTTSLSLTFNLEWTNQAIILRWNRLLSSNAFLNTSLSYTRYNNDVNTEHTGISINLSSGIQDAQIKSDLTVALNNQHTLRAGIEGTYHYFSIGQLSAKNDQNLHNFKLGTLLPTAKWSIYISDEWSISRKLSMALGLRMNNFHAEQKWHTGLSPRWNLCYLPHKDVSVKLSFARSYQFMHLVAPATSTLPTDLWYPSTKKVAPQYADIAAASLSFALGKSYYINLEGYYKWLYQQLDFKDGARIFINRRLDEEFIRGRGWSYGGEIYLEKKAGAFRGWIGYTLSWTWRQFDAINGGSAFHPPNDRRHNFSAVLLWDLPFTGPKFPITLSATWIYGSGKAVTIPKSRYIQTDIAGTNLFQFIPIYNERGNYRLPAYHRLDLGLVWKLYPLSKKRLKSDLTISIYNIYDRRNPFFMYINAVYSKDSNGSLSAFPDRLEGRIVSLFPIIPSVTWNFYW